MTTTDTTKLQELIVYIAACSEADPRFGKTKLFKILFYADFLFFKQTGRSMTGQDYRKAPFGPLPSDGEAILDELKNSGSLAMGRREYHGMQQLRPFALREPDLAAFSAPEIALVDHVVADLWEQTAADVSRVSHEFVGWQAARPGEIIPYETSLIDVSPLTEQEQDWARQYAANRK